MRVTCDTSVLVPALLTCYGHHAACRPAAARKARVVPAHVLLECFSVLTRLPAPYRVSPSDAGELILGIPLTEVALPAPQHRELVQVLAASGIRGGAIYRRTDRRDSTTPQRHAADQGRACPVRL